MKVLKCPDRRADSFHLPDPDRHVVENADSLCGTLPAARAEVTTRAEAEDDSDGDPRRLCHHCERTRRANARESGDTADRLRTPKEHVQYIRRVRKGGESA